MSIIGKIKKLLNRSSSDSYNNQIEDNVAVRVEHVSMEFKISKDKIDTLKEYVIRTIKRNKKEKEKIRILNDISFDVQKGDKLGILGFNGAGKSTLLKILAGIYEPTHGKITINGKVAPLLELSAGFDKNYTGKNNIYLNGAFLSMDKDFLDEKFDEIVEFSELGDFINYPVKNYSSGMRAKLGFSIATLPLETSNSGKKVPKRSMSLCPKELPYCSYPTQSTKSERFAINAFGLKTDRSLWKGLQMKFVMHMLQTPKATPRKREGENSPEVKLWINDG